MKVLPRTVKRVKLKRTGRVTSPVSASVQELDDTSFEEVVQPKPVGEQFIVNTEELEDELESGSDYSAVITGMLNADKFQELWRDKANDLVTEIQDAVATIYAFNDVATSMEELLIDSGVDKSAQLVDENFTKEVESLATFKLMLVLAAHLFKGEDYEAVRTFMLQPEEAGRLRKIGTSTMSQSIKELYDMAKSAKGGVAPPNQPPGMLTRKATP